MLQLFVRAFVAVAGAFVLGLAVGWLIWRLHRRSVPGEEWSASQQALEDLRRTLAEHEGQRDRLSRQVASWQAEASSLQSRVSSAWHEREAARTRSDELETELAALRAQLEQAVSHNQHLQRRVSELSLMISRGTNVRPDLGRSLTFTAAGQTGGAVPTNAGRVPPPGPGATTRPAAVPAGTLVPTPPAPGISVVPPVLAQTSSSLPADAAEAPTKRVHPPTPPSAVGAPSS